MKYPVDLSVVIPVFNEEGNCLPLFEELKAVLDNMDRTYEIVYVDDGSTDSSRQKLESIMEKCPSVRVIGFHKNCGQTAAFEAGFKAARGEFIVTLDADMQNDPRDIPLLLDAIADYDLVCGWREKRNDTFVRRASSIIANGVRKALSGDDVHDTGCSLKVFRSDYAKRFKLFTGMHRFFPTLVRIDGGRVTEVRVHHRARRHGVTKYNIRNRMVRSFLDLLAVCWMKKRWMPYEAEELRR